MPVNVPRLFFAHNFFQKDLINSIQLFLFFKPFPNCRINRLAYKWRLADKETPVRDTIDDHFILYWHPGFLNWSIRSKDAHHFDLITSSGDWAYLLRAKLYVVASGIPVLRYE